MVLKKGVLPQDFIDRMFVGQLERIKEVSVRFWPLVTARNTSYAASVADHFPELVATAVTEALVRWNEAIDPICNVITRDLLSLLPRREFSLSTVEALDAFLIVPPLVQTESEEA